MDLNSTPSRNVLTNDMMIEYYGSSSEALVLPAIVWEEVTAFPATFLTGNQGIRRGIRIETSDEKPGTIVIKQIDGSELETKLLPFLDYPMLIAGIVSTGPNVSKVLVAK